MPISCCGRLGYYRVVCAVGGISVAYVAIAASGRVKHMPALAECGPFPSRVWPSRTNARGDNKHPAHLPLEFSLAGRGHRPACLHNALPNCSFRAEWSKLPGGQARVSNGGSNHSPNPP